MDKFEIVVVMVQVVVLVGVVVVCIEGIENLWVVCFYFFVFIIGIIKCDFIGLLVCIIFYLQDVDVLVQVGVDIIVFDVLFCFCLVDIDSLLICICLYGLLVMVDCLIVNEGISCYQKGIEFIGIILFGYIGFIMLVELDLVMVI